MFGIHTENLMISGNEWRAMSPIIVVAIGAMLSLLVGTVNFGSYKYRKIPVFISGVLTLVIALFFAIHFRMHDPMRAMQGIVLMDRFSSYFYILLLSSGLLVMLAGYKYLEEEEIHYSEYYSLLLISIFGMMCLASTLELVSLFIALEIMSLGVYVLVGIRRFDKYSNEAAAKYFVMGGVASAVYLYGVALIYGALNSTNLITIAANIQQSTNLISNPIFILGAAFIFIGFLFKVAAFPFHMWTPDVYEGAPMIITSFMSTALKAAAFAALIRISTMFLGGIKLATDISQLATLFYGVLWWVAILTMVVGNIVALMQKNIKRMLAYSAIAHTGYLILGILVGPKVGYSSILIYLVPYTAMNIGAFTILSLFAGKMDKEATIESLSGVGYNYPMLGMAMAIFFLSLTGLPPTGGFIGKYFLFSAALEAGEIILVLLAVITSLISVYYYLRVVVIMYMRSEGAMAKQRHSAGYMAAGAIALCVIITLYIGVFPSAILECARKAALF